MSRTHRERKEQYIKALEHEILRVKELYGSSTRERDAYAADNRRLKELLASHGIPFDSSTPASSYPGMPGLYHSSTSGSVSASFRQDGSSTGLSPSPMNSALPHSHNTTPGSVQAGGAAQIPSGRLDYDQMGVDFVLTYDSYGRPIRPAYPSPPPGQ